MRREATAGVLPGLAMALGCATSSHAICDSTSGAVCAQIEIYADSACTTCNLVAPVGQWVSFFVVASCNDLDGIAGVELKIVGLPPEWQRVVVPNPAASAALGDPLGDVGGNIAFPMAQRDPCVHLYRVEIWPSTEMTDVRLEVTQRTPPTNPALQCPYIHPMCGATSAVACWTFYCAEVRPMTINGRGDCTVAVAAFTWGSVKRLYTAP